MRNWPRILCFLSCLVNLSYSQEVQQILDSSTFVRHPKIEPIPLESEFFTVLIQDWDLAYRLAKAMGVQGYQVQKQENAWVVGLGLTTSVHVVPLFHENGRSLFLAKGIYRGKSLQRLPLRALFLVEYHSTAQTLRKTSASMTAYIKVEQFWLAVLAKITLGFVGTRIDRKLASILGDVQKASEKINADPIEAYKVIEDSSAFNPNEKKLLQRYLLHIQPRSR